MARRREVVAGQRYQSVDSNAVWEVREVNPGPAGIPHARMVRIDDPTSVKLVAASVLRDPRRFRQMPDQSEPAG